MMCDDAGVAAAAAAVSAGGTVVFPTDTVYGIGCDPHDAGAVRRIYAAKSRDPAKALPVLAASLADAQGVAAFDARAMRAAAEFWPGGLTMVLGLADASLQDTMGLSDSVAVRVPGHECARALLGATGPLAVTSANRSGEPAPSDAASCRIECDVLLDGGRTGGLESTIADMRGGARVLREGAIPGGELSRIS